MASRINELKCRLVITEAALPRSGSVEMGPPLPPLGPHLAVTGSRPAGTGFADHCCHTPPPPPTYAAPVCSLGFLPLTILLHPTGTLSKHFVAVLVARRRWVVPKNAGYLPYAIEDIAAATKGGGGYSHLISHVLNADCSLADPLHSECGHPIYDMRYFWEPHFDWCLRHQRLVVQGHQTLTSRDHCDCQTIH
jgi:hypothetical protein